MARNDRLTVKHLWKLERPAQPTLSPDGAQACVSVATHDMDENTSRSSLWLYSAFGGEPRRLTSCGEKDGEPKWSPDGRWIAFVAKRPAVGSEKADDEPQLYLIAPDGGEARRVTDIATGVFGIKWFPGSRRVAFLSWVWPEEKGLKALAKRYKAFKDDKVKAHVVEHSAYRWWDRNRFIKSLDAGRISVDELSRMMGAGEKPIVLDVRSRVHREIDGRRIPGAVHVDLDALEATLAGIPRDRDVVVYCACPNEVTAVKVAMRLRERGIRRVRPLLGGIDAWVSAGFEIESL